MLVYGFDDPERPLDEAIDALDLLLHQRMTVGSRSESRLVGLRHPVFGSGRVVAWEINGIR